MTNRNIIKSYPIMEATMEEVLKHYNKGLENYKTRNFDIALESFKKAIEIRPNDGPSKVYVERCEHFVENPPPDDWDGVFTMTSK